VGFRLTTYLYFATLTTVLYMQLIAVWMFLSLASAYLFTSPKFSWMFKIVTWLICCIHTVYVKEIRLSDLTDVLSLWSDGSILTPDQNVQCLLVRFNFFCYTYRLNPNTLMNVIKATCHWSVCSLCGERSLLKEKLSSIVY
jgi:hypothetical protein